MWWFSRRFEDRWLNFFGVNKPLERDKVKISSELNTPVQGINRGVAVCFVTNGKKTYLAHRGNRWGSGKRGLDKNYFWDKFEGHHEIVEDDGLLSKVAIICTLGEAHLPRDLSSFVHWIVGIKSSQMIV